MTEIGGTFDRNTHQLHNAYNYARNNPMTHSDPFGQLFCSRLIYPIELTMLYFLENYFEMRNVNTQGADKYYHCMANCQASKLGGLAAGVAQTISELRELLDENVKGDQKDQCDLDRKANQQGLKGAPSESCETRCNSLRPQGLRTRRERRMR